MALDPVGPEAIALVTEKFQLFNIHSTTYQTVGSHSITADIFIPKDISPGPHPLIVRFHGGFLIISSSLFPGFFPTWTLDFALQQGAIIVSPNYRKLPESTGVEILENLARFWEWVRDELPAYLREISEGKLEVQLEKCMVVGNSAGGYLAAQSAFLKEARIKAIVAAYPMFDMRSPFFTSHYEKHPFGMPMLPSSIIDDHLAAMKPGEVVSAVTPPARLDLAVATVQWGRFGEMLGVEEVMYPIERLRKEGRFPPLFVFYGREDRAVEVEGTERFVKVLREVDAEAKVVVKVEEGDHGFDVGVGLEEPWLKEGLDFVTKEWLG